MTRAAADFPSLATLAQQEKELVLGRFDESDAWLLGTLAVNTALAQQAMVSIGIRVGGRQLFHCGLPGSARDNDEWIRRKGRVVERFGHSSLFMGQLCRDMGTTMLEKFAVPPGRYAAAGGAFPLRVANAGVIGWCAVSGLPQVEDHMFVTAVLTEFTGSARQRS